MLLVLAVAACGGSKTSSPATTAAATTTAGGGASQASGTKLTGSVGPGYTISLTQNSQNVTKLAPGTYTFVVNDRATIHGFTLQQTQGGSSQKT